MKSHDTIFIREIFFYDQPRDIEPSRNEEDSLFQVIPAIVRKLISDTLARLDKAFLSFSVRHFL